MILLFICIIIGLIISSIEYIKAPHIQYSKLIFAFCVSIGLGFFIAQNIIEFKNKPVVIERISSEQKDYSEIEIEAEDTFQLKLHDSKILIPKCNTEIKEDGKHFVEINKNKMGFKKDSFFNFFISIEYGYPEKTSYVLHK